ncbi:cyclin-dependent kinase F-4-like [Cryptomeria japonica]|uniref:cyclin-dependent kinase F-4-like n=1 Tax=Cryptomeria japonica TaxID=3369 RepID=UPI0027D9E79B|nr:cyclin-dependent kinase F-4-like [Cryptomeria japonica]
MGKYRLIEKLGEGGYGTVWKAINKWTDQVVVIKRLHKKNNDRFYESLFKEEEKSLRALQHPNIVSLWDTYEEGGQLNIVLEYMDFDLWRIIKNRKEPSLSRTVQRLCFKILKALEYMHGLGYSHHDLKPENILLKENNIKISDFELAINLKRKWKRMSPWIQMLQS